MRPAFPLRQLLGALLALTTVLHWASTAAAEELVPLLARMEQAYGSATLPASIMQHGRTVSQMQGEGALIRAYRGPERFRIEIRYPEGTEVRIIDGTRAWQRNKPMSEIFRGALVLQAARVALPWNLLAARETLRDGGEHAVGEGRLHFIELPLPGGLKIIVEVDPDSGLIRRSRGILPADNGSEMVFGTIYEDFRSVGGRRYAAVEHHFAGGRYIGRSYIEDVEFDLPLPDTLFRPEIPGMI